MKGRNLILQKATDRLELDHTYTNKQQFLKLQSLRIFTVPIVWFTKYNNTQSSAITNSWLRNSKKRVLLIRINNIQWERQSS